MAIKHYIKNLDNQDGAVALITTVIISILLLITTSGMVALTVKSIRQSSDGSQSTRAYYAAESGVEQALLAIRRGDDLSKYANCTLNKIDTNSNLATTCIRVSLKTNSISGTVAQDKSVQVDLSGVKDMTSVTVQWGQQGTYNPASVPNLPISGNFPKPNQSGSSPWPAGEPPLLETGVIDFPASNITINGVGYRQFAFAPVKNPANRGYTDYTLSKPSINPLQQDKANANKLTAGTCSTAATTNPTPCTAVLVGLDGTNNRYVLRLKPRYANANYKITVNGASGELAIPSSVYTVDVTAQSGKAFRRVVTTFDSSGATPAGPDGLDYVLFSDTNICKSFEIKGTSIAPNNCPIP